MKRINVGSPKNKPNAISLPALKNLVKWFQRSRRVLPWREDPSLYRVWISEIMLQQTQVITVLPYFERFMQKFPTVEALARAPEESVMKAWEGLGYYSRARNLHRGAKSIVESGFPQTREAWLEVPGVGPYTAGAITSIALGLPEPIVDGNVERVFARLRTLSREKIGETPYKEMLWELSRAAVTRAHSTKLSPSELNQAWMELGATICTPRNPECERCPISSECLALRSDAVTDYPTKKKRAEWILVKEARVALLDPRGGKVYLEKTAAGEWREGLWDFPVRLPKGLPKGVKKIAEFETKHVVTRHKIERKLTVYVLPAKVKPGSGRMISLDEPEVPVSSAPLKGMRALSQYL